MNVSNMRVWLDVPIGSTILFGIEVPPGKFVSAHVDCAGPAGPLPPIPNNEIKAGIAQRCLDSPPTHYVYTARITFGSECTATFRAHIEGLDMSTYGQPFAYAVAGKPGDVGVATLICIMEPAT